MRLLSKIDTGEANDGDAFTATVAEPVSVGGRTVIAKGVQASGRVVKAVGSGRLKTTASLTLELVKAGSYSLTTAPLTMDGKSHGVRDAELIGGGAAAGAIIGAIAGGGKGAAIGAAAGAGTGTAVAYLTGKKELVLPVEMPLRFQTAGGASAGNSTASSPAQNAPAPAASVPSGGGTSFSDSDRGKIGQYFSDNRANLPPGLAKRDRLPPGLEKQLARNGTLPPGLQKRAQPFPAELNQQLPRLPAGCSRVIVGNHAILLDQGQRILDMFSVQ